MNQKKHEIITFKADASLLKAMEGVPNRSEFIRSAIMSALNNVCPLCNGTGILNHDQQQHWEVFLRNHSIEECEECHQAYIVCEAEVKGN